MLQISSIKYFYCKGRGKFYGRMKQRNLRFDSRRGGGGVLSGIANFLYQFVLGKT
jgi:hypothetical protein